MREFIIDKLMELEDSNEDYIIEYVDYCLSRNAIGTNRQNHHILPVSVFPSYQDFEKFKWNSSVLDLNEHYIAHSKLYHAVNNISFASAWYAMNNKNYVNILTPINLIGEETHSMLLARRNKLVSSIMKNIVMAKCLITNENKRVTREEFENNENLGGVTHGSGWEHLQDTISIKGENNKSIRISKFDFDPAIHEGHTTGRSTFKNKDGDVLMLEINDPRVLSGEFVGIAKGNTFKNPNSKGQQKRILIYNNNDEVVYSCYGNFVATCKEHNLPINRLRKTRAQNNKITFDFDNMEKYVYTKLKNSGVLKFEGWYARSK